MDPETQVGPMARANLRDELHDQVVRSIQDGAVCAFGGAPLEREGSWYAPTDLTDVTSDHTSFQKELFGPVASIIRCRDVEHAGCGLTSMINGITAFDPGAKIGVHFHNCEESVMILEGEAVAEIDGQRHHLRAGDSTFIPPNVPHRFLNESDKLMRIFWIYADINASRTMVATGIEQTIDDEHEKAKRL